MSEKKQPFELGTPMPEEHTISSEKLYELGSVEDPLYHVPKPDAQKVAQMYFGRSIPSQPWIDANDLQESELYIQNVPDGHTAYQWRDTQVILIVNNESNEIVDIYEFI